LVQGTHRQEQEQGKRRAEEGYLDRRREKVDDTDAFTLFPAFSPLN